MSDKLLPKDGATPLYRRHAHVLMPSAEGSMSSPPKEPTSVFYVPDGKATAPFSNERIDAYRPATMEDIRAAGYVKLSEVTELLRNHDCHDPRYGPDVHKFEFDPEDVASFLDYEFGGGL
jgi:hypothetical protein